MEWKVQSSPAQRTKRSTRPAHSQDTPFSPVAARLIEQIQAEARATLLAELSAKDGVIVLHPVDPETKRVRFDLEGDVTIRDQRGTVINLMRRREQPESWRDSPTMQGKWHPSHWGGHQTLVDAQGRDWLRGFEVMVIDDFGNLVEVAV